MEILRYSLAEEEKGNEQQMVNLFRNVGIQADDVQIDRKSPAPQIIIQSYSREMGDLIRTIARLCDLRREPAPEPMESAA